MLGYIRLQGGTLTYTLLGGGPRWTCAYLLRGVERLTCAPLLYAGLQVMAGVMAGMGHMARGKAGMAHMAQGKAGMGHLVWGKAGMGHMARGKAGMDHMARGGAWALAFCICCMQGGRSQHGLQGHINGALVLPYALENCSTHAKLPKACSSCAHAYSSLCACAATCLSTCAGNADGSDTGSDIQFWGNTKGPALHGGTDGTHAPTQLSSALTSPTGSLYAVSHQER